MNRDGWKLMMRLQKNRFINYMDGHGRLIFDTFEDFTRAIDESQKEYKEHKLSASITHSNSLLGIILQDIKLGDDDSVYKLTNDLKLTLTDIPAEDLTTANQYMLRTVKNHVALGKDYSFRELITSVPIEGINNRDFILTYLEVAKKYYNSPEVKLEQISDYLNSLLYYKNNHSVVVNKEGQYLTNFQPILSKSSLLVLKNQFILSSLTRFIKGLLLNGKVDEIIIKHEKYHKKEWLTFINNTSKGVILKVAIDKLDLNVLDASFYYTDAETGEPRKFNEAIKLNGIKVTETLESNLMKVNLWCQEEFRQHLTQSYYSATILGKTHQLEWTRDLLNQMRELKINVEVDSESAVLLHSLKSALVSIAYNSSEVFSYSFLAEHEKSIDLLIPLLSGQKGD